MDVAGLDDAPRERPSEGPGRKTGRELRFEFGGESGVAGIFPISMPTIGHAEKKAEPEGLARDNRGGVGHEGGFDECLALVELGGGKRSEKEKGRKKNGKKPAGIAEV